MAGGFDAETLEQLRTTKEVRILAGEQLDKSAIIWIVVDGDDVFIRSFLGAKGRWYKAAAADGRAMLELADRRMPVRVTAATDALSIKRASRQFLGKYNPSPYAQKMVQPELLMTTLRVEPL